MPYCLYYVTISVYLLKGQYSCIQPYIALHRFSLYWYWHVTVSAWVCYRHHIVTCIKSPQVEYVNDNFKCINPYIPIHSTFPPKLY